MSRAEMEKWDQKYRDGEFTPNHNPSALLVEWLPRIQKEAVGRLSLQSRALDVACGLGRNALFLAQQGFTVDAIDISSAGLAIARQKALEKGLKINWIQADLDTFDLPSQTYDLVIDNFYLNRPLAPRLIESLKPGGILLFEHHIISGVGTTCRAHTEGPTNPELRLKSGELKDLFHGLEVLHYEEGPVLKDGELVPLARLVARKKA